MLRADGANDNPLMPARHILVVRYRFIGDTILTVPFLRNLRRAYPDAVIDVLVGPSSGEVLKHCPYINQLITFDTTRFHKYDRGAGRPRHLMAYALDLRQRDYDTVFVLKRSFSSGLLSWLTGAKSRIGYDTQGRSLFLTHRVKWNRAEHEVDSLLNVLRAVNVPILDDYLECWLSEQEREEIVRLVPELTLPGGKVVVHAAAAHPDKMYPLASWASVIAKLFDSQGLRPYFTGSDSDRPLYQELEELAGVPAVNLAGRLNLRQSMALYQQMDLAVCVDSGPAHLAAAVNTPTVCIFGPTDPQRWRPWGREHQVVYDDSLPCRPCHYNKSCDDRPCLTALSPQVVLDACFKIQSARQYGLGVNRIE